MNPNPIIPLEEIRIAKPCRADWNAMTGDQRARFCGSCHKNVYDLSQMTREQAHQLIAEKEGHVCLRLYRRPDGTVITSDCPVGKREVMKPMWWTLAGFVALMASGAAVWSQPKSANNHAQPTPLVDKARNLPIIGAVVNAVAPAPVTMGDMAPMMGVIAPPAPTPAPTNAPTPAPTNAPLMGRVTMGTPAVPAPQPTVEPVPEMGEVALVCPPKE